MVKQWTPEERASQSAKMKASHAAKRGTEPPVPAAPADDDEPSANPLPTDIIDDPSPSATPPTTPRAGRRSSPPARPAPAATAPPTFDISTLVSDLTSLPLEQLSYDDCGTLLNTLSAASTAVATARRLKQESLAAGTHRAPCTTCGRQIDISKPGGFQILTVRDEHWQPKNVYFCSQSCLLAQNMPSRAKTQKRMAGDTA